MEMQTLTRFFVTVPSCTTRCDLPDARRSEHGAENGRRARTEPADSLEARSVFAGNASGARGITPTMAGTLGAAGEHEEGNHGRAAYSRTTASSMLPTRT